MDCGRRQGPYNPCDMVRRKPGPRQVKAANRPTALPGHQHRELAYPLTIDIIRRFAHFVGRRGLPPDGACDYLGIPPHAFWSWIRRGEAYVHGDRTPKGDALYGKFYLTLKRSMARYRVSVLDRLHEGQKNWTCWMTILERRDRTNYHRNEPAGGDIEDYNPDERFL